MHDQVDNSCDTPAFYLADSSMNHITPHQLRAIELVFLFKASCESVCQKASLAEANGEAVDWPVSGEDKLVPTSLNKYKPLKH